MIYGVKMRLSNVIGEYIVRKNFKGKKFRHLANFYEYLLVNETFRQ